MAVSGRSNGMVIGIVLLVVALIVVFFLWQRDRESTDLNIDIGAIPAVTLPVT